MNRSRWPLRLGLLLALTVVAVFSSGFLCGPGFSPPEPDSCSGPEPVTGTFTVGPGDDPFRAWTDGEITEIVTGGQGSDMIPIRLRLTGAPACIAQTTLVNRITPEGTFAIAQSSSPLRTYEEQDGTRTTRPLFLIVTGYAPSGSELEVRTTIGGTTQTVQLFVSELPMQDAGDSD